MRRAVVIASAVVLVFSAVVVTFGIKRVPDGHEGLRIAKNGNLDVYSGGIHLVKPGHVDFVHYRVGEVDYRIPESGSAPVLTDTGEEVGVAFEFRVVVPPGGSKRLYGCFGRDFDHAMSRLVLEAAEIEGARFSRSGEKDNYRQSVAQSVRQELSNAGVEVLSCKLLRWGDYEGPDGVTFDKPLRKLVIVGIDGGDWLNLAPMMAAGELPNFKKLVDGGATGPLRSIEPMLSPLLWTTMATGKYPEDHGILNFTVVDPETGNKIPITRRYRKVDAFWNMVGDYGLSVDVAGWLATHPAEEINGVMVTDKVGYLAYAIEDKSERSSESVCPESRLDEIYRLVERSSSVRFEECNRMLHIDREEFESNRAIDFDPKNPINTMILLYASTKTYRNIALHLLEKDRPDLLAVYFEWVDAVSHLFMLHSPPKLPETDEAEYRKFRDAVAQAYIYQDEILGQFMDKLDDETVLMVVSDHGFKSGGSRLKNRPELWAGNAAKWHRINGIVGLYGNGVKKGYKIKEASILDVAPTILALQGLPRASDMPGNVLTEALEPKLKEALDPNVVATLQRDRAEEVTGSPADAAAATETMKKLEALGYLTPDNADAHNNLGQRYQQRGEYLKAIAEYEKALALRPLFHSVYNNIAVCYGKLKQYAEAEKALLKAIEIKPGDFYAMNNLAITYIETRRLDDARRTAEQAVKIEPGYVNGHVTLGSIYAMTGRLEKAEKEFETALNLEPGDPKAAENLKRVRQQMRGIKGE